MSNVADILLSFAFIGVVFECERRTDILVLNCLCADPYFRSMFRLFVCVCWIGFVLGNVLDLMADHALG